MDYNHVFVRKKNGIECCKNDKNFKIRLSDLQKCCCIILYKPDGRILKFLSFLQHSMPFFYEQIHDYNPFSFTIPFAV